MVTPATRRDAVVTAPAATVRVARETVRRAPATRPATVVPNDVLNDTSISFRALGLLGMFLSQPEDVPITTDQFASLGGREGRDALRKAMNELIQARYAIRRKWQDDGGRWHTETVVYDAPQPEDVSAGHTEDGFPVVGFIGAGEGQPVDNSAPEDVSAGHTEDGFPVVGFSGIKSQSQDQDQSQNHHPVVPQPDNYREPSAAVPDDDFSDLTQKQVKILRGLDLTAAEAWHLFQVFRHRAGSPPANVPGWLAACIKREPDILALLPGRPAARRGLHDFDEDPDSHLCRRCHGVRRDSSRHPVDLRMPA